MEPKSLKQHVRPEQCVSEEAEPRRGADTRRYANKNTGPQRGWIVRSQSVAEENETPFITV